MAMNTYLQMVSDAELEALRDQPSSINRLVKPAEASYSTYYACSINYFLAGDAYPSEGALASMLFGATAIETDTLENGSFGVVTASEAKALARALAELDLGELEARVRQADPDELADEEVDDFELLVEDEDPAKLLVAEIRQLVAFYAGAAERNMGVAMFTA